MPILVYISRIFKPAILRIVGLLSFLVVGLANISAATITTTGSGNWNSTIANAPWPGGTVPAVGDIVIIASGHTVNLTANVTKTGSSTVTINQGGVLNLNASLTVPASTSNEITVSGTLNINVANGLLRSGNAGAGSNAIVTATGVVDLTTTASNENVTVWDLQTGSTLKLSASGNQTLDADFVGAAVDNLTLSGSGIKTLGENTTVSQILSVEGTATFATGGYTLTYGTGATLRYLTTDIRTVGAEWPSTFSGTGGIIIGNTSGSVAIGAAKVLGTSAPFTINSGSTFITNNFQLTLGNNFTNNGGTFTPGTGTVIFNGNATAINGTSPVQSFYNLTLNKTAGQTLSVGGSTTTLNIGGAFTQTTGNFSAPATMTVTGNTTLTAGTFTAGNNLNVGGNFTNNGATFTPGTGTVTFNGSTAAINGTTATQTFNNIVVSKTAGQTLSVGGSTTTLSVGGTFTQSTGNFAAPATMAVTSNTTLTAGTFTAGTNLTLTGDLTNNGATFTSGTGTVTMNGSSKTIGGTSSFTFNNLTINNPNGIILGNNQTVSGVLTLSSGILNTSTNLLSITNTSTSAISGGLANTFINGPVKWTMPANLVSGSTYNFPIGKGTNYMPFSLVNPTTGTGTITAQVEAYETNSGGSLDATLASKSTTEYWSLSTTGNFTNSSINLTRPLAITSFDVIGGSSSLAGTYTSLNGTVGTNGITNSDNIGANRYFAFAKKPLPLITGNLGGSSFCQGATLLIPYTANVTFNSGNIFTAQISNSSGSFASPISIGTTSSTTTGTISATIPANATAGSGYRIRVISSNPAMTGTDNGVNLSINALPGTPTTTGAQICIGTASGTTLYASGANSGDKYKWYDAASGGNLLKTSVDNTDNTYSTATLAATTNYWVSILNASGCESSRIQATATYPANSSDAQTTAGSNLWIGHVYDGTNQAVAYNGSFTNYYGYSSENETFDVNFGGGESCYNIASTLGSRSIYAETFSVRYRMNSTRKGLYTVDLGSDDGGRLSVDGNLVYNNWNYQSYTISPRVLLSLSGTSSLVYDFFENGGENRVSFQNLTQILANNLTTNTTQSVNLGNSGVAISGDVFGTLPSGISLSGTGYQWTYSTTPGGARTAISGATGATYTPNTTVAPFNVAGTYYIFRNSIISSANNVAPNPYIASNESNYATLVVNNPLITVSPTTLSGFNYIATNNGPSAEQSFTISGTYLSSNITVTPPTNYEISLTSGTAYVSTPILLTQSGGNVATTTLYVRLKAGLSAGPYNSENIAATSYGATQKNVICSGSVNAPTITTSVASITTFNYPVSFGPSNATSFTVTGTYLENNITVTAPTNFELSSSLPFSAVNVLVIPAVSGTVNTVPVYVRMKSGLPLGSVAVQNIDITSDNATTKNVACSGTVLPIPTLQLTPTAITTGFTYVYAASTTPIQSFTVSGANLVSGEPVILTPSANFEISRLGGTNFTPETSISLLHTATPTSLPDTTIYVRMRLGLGIGTQTGTIDATTTSASQQTLTLSGTVSPAPTITTSTTLLSAFLYTSGAGPSQPQSFTVTGTNLITNITVTPPTNYEIKLSTSGTYSSNPITVTQSSGNASATINVRLKTALAIGTYGPFNIALATNGAVGKAVSVTGNVVANSPLISASKSTLTGFGYLSSEGGNTQAAQSFVVSGTSLAANITVAPPANYVISTSPNSGFQSTNLTITRSGTIVAPTPIYIKLATSLPAGDYGTLISPVYVALTSGTASQVNINCIGKVFASPLITASGGGTFCQGESITLHSSGPDIIKRFWEGPNNFYSSISDPVLTTSATPTMTGTYNVTGNVYVGGNLVTNGDFQAGNSSFGSGYTYVVPGKTLNANGNLWPESYYTVDVNPLTSHINFSACADHTTGTGKQMIINGSGTAGVVIWSQAVPVVPNASYEFSYWVQTVVSESPSKLQLYVNGIAAGPVYTADLATCSWKQFIYNTTAGPSTTYVNLELINQNTALSGNDFALDDIVFQQILSATASTSVTVNPSMPVSVTVTASANPVYQNTPVTFTATPVNGGTTPAYQWKRKRAGVITDVGTNSTTFTTSDLQSSDSIYCVLTSNVSCPTGNPATSNKIGITVIQRLNYWMGYVSTDWGTAANWTNNTIPLTGDDVEYATVANFGHAAERDLWLDVDRTIGNLINATTKRLVIPAGKGLTVNYSISTDGNPDRIYIYSSTTGANGSLIFHNATNYPVSGTVEMYSKAWINPAGVQGQGTKYNWQYFGIPLRSLGAFPSFSGSYVRKWFETGTSISNHWIQLTNSSTLVPFYGYELCQTNAKTFAFKGTLENGNFSSGTLPVTYGKQGVPNALFPGQHIFANPYTAAIDIRQLSFGEGTLKTVYIYNTGTFEAWTNGSQTPASGNNLTPGQYTSVPYNLAGTGSLPRQIPSMQAILVKTLSSTSESTLATFGINYNSATLMKNTIAQRAKADENNFTDKIFTLLDVKGENFSDKVWLFTEPNCSRTFDNGWDGEKLISDSKLTPKIYAEEPDGIYQVSTVNDINNTNLSFIAGKDINYTITVTNENVKKRYAGIYLYDAIENKVIDITETGSTYTFMADSTKSTKNRFKIATRNFEYGTPDALKQVKVFNSGKSIFVDNHSANKGTVVLYDMAGRAIKRISVMPNTITALSTNLVSGAYVAKVVYGNEEITKRLIVN